MSKDVLVVDSSVIVKWLSADKEEHIAIADKILEDVQTGKVELLVPELAKYEIGNALLLGKKLSLEGGNVALTQLFRLPITFISSSQDLSLETYKIALTHGITYYDASFLALAKQYDATLITENTKHQGKAKKIKVKSLEKYYP